MLTTQRSQLSLRDELLFSPALLHSPEFLAALITSFCAYRLVGADVGAARLLLKSGPKGPRIPPNLPTWERREGQYWRTGPSV